LGLPARSGLNTRAISGGRVPLPFTLFDRRSARDYRWVGASGIGKTSPTNSPNHPDADEDSFKLSY